MEIVESSLWLDDNDVGLSVDNYIDALVIDLYKASSVIEDEGMQFIFKNNKHLEEFIEVLNYKKEIVWPI